MSDRLDLVLLTVDGLAIHHDRWGATALFDLLLGGPDRALGRARGLDQTQQLDDSLAAAVIDVVHRQLIIAGPSAVICAAGPRRVEPQELLGELAPCWPGWRLAYEPATVVAPVVLYLRGLGLSIASLNAPRPDFVAPTYSLDAPLVEAPAVVVTSTDLSRRLDSFDLSFRALGELEDAGLATLGDVAGKGTSALAQRGLSARVLRELGEILEAEGLVL